MKKVFLSAAVVFAASFAMKASANGNYAAPVQMVQDTTTKTPLKLEELPDPIKTVLAADPYKGWIPASAFLVKDAKGVVYYQVDVKKEAEVKALKFDKDGKPVQ